MKRILAIYCMFICGVACGQESTTFSFSLEPINTITQKKISKTFTFLVNDTIRYTYDNLQKEKNIYYTNAQTISIYIKIKGYESFQKDRISLKPNQNNIINLYINPEKSRYEKKKILRTVLKDDTVEVTIRSSGCFHYSEQECIIAKKKTLILSGKVDTTINISFIKYLRIKRIFKRGIQLRNKYHCTTQVFFVFAGKDGNKKISFKDARCSEHFDLYDKFEKIVGIYSLNP